MGKTTKKIIFPKKNGLRDFKEIKKMFKLLIKQLMEERLKKGKITEVKYLGQLWGDLEDNLDDLHLREYLK